MKLCDINPHIRFAAQIHYIPNGSTVKVTDCRIFYITAGQAQLRIANQNYTLKPNALFYCRGGNTYSIDAPEGFDVICLNFDMTQAHNDVLIPFTPSSTDWDKLTVLNDHVEDSDVLNGHFYLENADDLLPPILKILDTFSKQPPYLGNTSAAA